MSRGPHTFKQADLTRAIKGARAAGINVARIEIGKDGKIVILPTQSVAALEIAQNEWDEVLGANDGTH
jgi:hypothetical protein